ncbi:DUF6512 family protein [Ruegeria arenilitoris]|uniref:DUF6512 family protein n=1 Tax=Ruegeria arenilitoris TaxID=1173585 RepID=UPI00147AC867|nr:DUF6512 family protein [Ruegeria arenilitoris]
MLENSFRLVWLEAVGTVFMILFGFGLHFAFALLASWTPVALVAAVNESIWEHLKLAFWPGLFWAYLMPLLPQVSRRDILSSKGVSLATTAVFIVTAFSAYTAVLGYNLLAVDIGIFVAAVCVGQSVSILLLVYKNETYKLIHVFGLVLLGLQVAAYSTFTFSPPDHWLFIEAQSGVRGIPTR